jgi:hypothetical protein
MTGICIIIIILLIPARRVSLSIRAPGKKEHENKNVAKTAGSTRPLLSSSAHQGKA